MPEAYSIDGRTFAFSSDIEDRLLPGGYVSVTRPGEDGLLGQVLAVTDVPGGTFSTPGVQGTGVLIGGAEPFVGAKVEPAFPEEVVETLGLRQGMIIGELADLSEAPASLRPEGFGRHTFVCGQSGSGKTYTTGLILERLLHETSLELVILDPNSDYVRLGELRSQEELAVSSENYERLKERHRSVTAGLQVLGGESSDLRLWLGNLTPKQQATVLGLDPIENAEEVAVALSLVEALGTSRFNPEQLAKAADARAGAAARRLALRIRNLGLNRMSIWADDDHRAIVDRVESDKRALLFDLGHFDRPLERSILTAAIVGAIWARRHERRPRLIVIDEAHNACPRVTEDPNLALATEHLINIAAEGRKFGIYLMLSTQRPDKIHDQILSQCDNLVLMRMNSRADIQRLISAFSGAPPALLERSARFALGEGLAYGKIAPHPILFKTGRRLTPEGGKDIPADWASALL